MEMKTKRQVVAVGKYVFLLFLFVFSSNTSSGVGAGALVPPAISRCRFNWWRSSDPRYGSTPEIPSLPVRLQDILRDLSTRQSP